MNESSGDLNNNVLSFDGIMGMGIEIVLRYIVAIVGCHFDCSEEQMIMFPFAPPTEVDEALKREHFFCRCFVCVTDLKVRFHNET